MTKRNKEILKLSLTSLRNTNRARNGKIWNCKRFSKKYETNLLIKLFPDDFLNFEKVENVDLMFSTWDSQ